MESRLDNRFSPLRRRDLLVTLAATSLLAGPGWAAPPTPRLKALLDRAAAAGEPAMVLEALREDDRNGLTRVECAIVDMVAAGARRDLALKRAFPFGKPDGASPYVLSHRHGVWTELGGKADPAELARRMDEENARLEAESARGIIPPAFLLDPILQTERRHAASAPAMLGAAIGRQIAILERLRARPSPGAGVWHLPGGADYYALRLRCTSGTDLTPAEVDRRVTAATERLLARADRLLRGLELTRGSVGARLRALKARQVDYYANDDAGRSRAVADMNAALDRIRPHMPLWFNPPLELKSVVMRMSAADEAAARRGYRDLPADGRPGTYFPDLGSVDQRPRWTLVTVAAHETFPGHALQARRQAIANPHPLQVRYAAGYGEGWSVYAESLVDRMGLLSPVEQLGFIQSILFRFARVTADIGIHLHRWSRERAIDYLRETVGFELFFPFDVEVDRYCAEPAGFAGDALSVLTLMRLGAGRSGAALRRFHDAVLNSGPLGVEALEVVARNPLTLSRG